MQNKTVRLFSFLLVSVLILSLFPLCASAEDTVIVFTKQPQSAVIDNFEDHTITWETKGGDCTYMLMIGTDGVAFGNGEYITSPYTIEYMIDRTMYYRIAAITLYDTFYSEPFSVTWQTAKDVTAATVKPIDFGKLPLGYKTADPLPIVIKNTGKNAIRDPAIELGYGFDQIYEIIQNKEPHNIKPGETDGTTWSIRPKNGLGVGDYSDSVYITAKNFETMYCADLKFEVIESDVPLTYALSCADVDFGEIEYGYGWQGTPDLVVRAVGTGNLTGVRVEADGSDFCQINENSASIDLKAGTGSLSNWYVVLFSGLEPGDYTAYAKVYANEVDAPLQIKIHVKVLNEGETAAPATAPPDGPDTSEPTQSGTPTTPGTAVPEDRSVPAVSIIIISVLIAVIVLLLAVIAAVVIIVVVLAVKKKKK